MGVPRGEQMKHGVVFGRVMICLLVFMGFMIGMMGSAQAQFTEMARVVFVHGEVSVMRDAQSFVPKVGDVIAEGDRLRTLQEAHIHLTTIDQGFISLRPNSELWVEQYQYQAQDPTQTHIKLVLEHGVMRSVSGKGAQAAKEHYRLNTPVSAIGVRGTDYSVLATAELSRITVQSGGVVMSPYNDQCVVNSDQQCQGETLFAHQGRAMLTLSQLQSKPQLILNPPVQQTPDGAQQPLPQENHASGEQRTSDKSGDKLTHRATAGASLPVFTGEVLQQVKAIQAPEEAGRQVFWGKWQPIANLPADEAIKQLSALKLVGFNDVFMIKKDEGVLHLPSKGSADFKLTQGEAYIQQGNDYKNALTAEVQKASLRVDFEHKTFETQLSVVGQERTIPFYAKGNVTSEGQLYATRKESNGGLVGGLAGSGADSATYLFQTHDLRSNAGYSAIGITQWQK